MVPPSSLSSLLPEPKQKTKSDASLDGYPVNAEGQDNLPVVGLIFDSLQPELSPVVSFSDFVPLRQRNFNMEIPLPTQQQIDDTNKRTKAFFQALLLKKSNPAGSKIKRNESSGNSGYIEYRSKNLLSANSESTPHLIKVVDHAADPLHLSNFKIRSVYAPPIDEPPAPILHKTDANLSKEERQKWEIPAAVSSWKNPNGYTIGLDKRVALDARYSDSRMGAHDINEGFVRLSEALGEADRKARQELKLKAEARKQLAEQESKMKEEQLRMLAQRAKEEREKKRAERFSGNIIHDEAARERAIKRDERRKEAEKDLNLSKLSVVDKLKALAHTQGRDISEKIILGAAKATEVSELQYDSQLLSRGANAAVKRSEDQLYDSPLFIQEAISSIYRPAKFGEADNSSQQIIESINGEARFEELNSKRARIESSQQNRETPHNADSELGKKKQRH
ncbi:mRNA splicing protein PRP45 Ecym_5059 [Eremothecium cymbalariae DBVPG|uniref:Pre-mRNA-processing protein 45 n=1 Tax=Eremothecium cymbalariae (strain CBS 270.75 / DBVPG 7215 / KCTC 17166 / NRRL Y-17582) TaxID=931890 RepID=I6NCQ7_ERECY|nr:hypothetical protein Ecym_5059 [Eremothecium cymbalariae DBVPG\